MDMQRLIKILSITTSTHDGEALNAIRMANAMLKEHGKRWEEVIVIRAQLPTRSEQDIHRDRSHAAYNQAQRNQNPYFYESSKPQWDDIDGDFDNIFRRKV